MLVRCVFLSLCYSDYIHWEDRQSGAWLPYLVTCRAGHDLQDVPKVAALVGRSCELATNALRVIHQEAKEGKKGLALCHKFLFNPTQDYSKRFALLRFLIHATRTVVIQNDALIIKPL